MSRKVKYDLTFKVKCVKEVLEGESISRISSRAKINESILRKWLNDYEAFGLVGLEPKTKNSTYSPKFKLKVLQVTQQQNLSLREARIKFKIPNDSTILKWQKDFLNFGPDGLISKPKGRPKTMELSKRKSVKTKQVLTREEELLLENERLRCENAFLKKYNALVQAEQEALKKQRRKPSKN